MKLLALAVVAAIFTAGAIYNMSQKQTVSDVPTPVYDSWVHWKKRWGKSYGTNSEEDQRLKNFNDNYKVVMEHNSKKSTWSLTLGKFADMTTEEVAKNYTGFKK